MENSRFKFRAWHKGFDYPATKTPVPAQMLYEDRMGQCLTWKEQGQPLELMQFTGLTDCHGKEIYEGDVLRATIFFDGVDLPHMGAVVYCEEYASFATRNDAGSTLFHNHCVNAREVIGNVYEHPHLLERS